MERNVFIYWVGKEFKLIKKLRDIIYYHSDNGNNYKVFLLNRDNIESLINIPNNFDNLIPAHQSDYVRVNVILKYGGIYLDSDTLVMDDLSELFKIFETKSGFFIKENNEYICNGVFGSKANTEIMIKWKEYIDNKLNYKLGWTDLGSQFFITNSLDLSDYIIFDGLDNMYPVNWNRCVEEYLRKPYENYKSIIREFQPLIILVNSIYKDLELNTYNNPKPLDYFIYKSIEK